MKTWKLTLEYDGSKYSGWQEQPNARTVQGVLRAALAKLVGPEMELQGAGRTDAGVHALAQVAHLRVPVAAARRIRNPGAMARDLNEALPADVAVLKIEDAPYRFHARHDALARTYLYQISRRKTAFSKKYVWWVKEPLDLEAMSAAAARIAGRHDFVCFRAPDPTKPEESSTVVVKSATIEVDEDTILFRITASHFVWRMVRRLAGTLVKLGKGEITAEDWDRLLRGKAEARLDVAAWTAPASGLFLESVEYRDSR